MKKIQIVFLLCFVPYVHFAQQGCTDPNATNYLATATYNDGSCTYASTNYSLTSVATLPSQLNEISGMVHYNGKIYGHQDSGGPTALYEVDPATGSITKTITLVGVTNVDWEDMTQDDTHFYIADVGNNSNGNRTDLKFYKFAKALITAGATVSIPNASIEVINFSYEDQTNFTATGGNNTEFDCEAVAFNRGKLHLFTKNWIGTTTVHYVLPTTAGTHSAERLDSFDIGTYKITGAAVGAFDLLILIGYETSGSANCALFLDFGFDGTYSYLGTGAKRRLDLGSAAIIGQVEGICFVNALHGYASNERFTYTIPFAGSTTIDQQLYTFNIMSYIQAYYEHNQVTFSTTAVPPSAGTIRFNATTNVLEGYDGTHWNPFH